MFRLCFRLCLVVVSLTALAATLMLAVRGQTPPTALVYSQFERGIGRYYVYLDPMRGVRARQSRLLHSITPFQNRPMSPDGKTFIATRPTEGGVDLFAVEMPEGTQRQLTRLDAFPPVQHAFNQMRSNTYPVWSPDGNWIAFISSDRMANMDIYLISPSGDELRRVARDVSTPAPLQIRWGGFQEQPFDSLAVIGLATMLFLVIFISKPIDR